LEVVLPTPRRFDKPGAAAGSGQSQGGTALKKKIVIFVAALAGLAMLAVAGPKLEMSWKNPGYSGGQFNKILVLALNGKAANRMEFEDRLVAAITRPGGKAYPSYEFIMRPDATPIDMKDMRELVKEQHFDAIVVARVTKHDTTTTYVPGQVYAPVAYYRTFYGYYNTLYPVVYTPGYMQTERVGQVEVNMYSTAKPDGELVWTGITNTFEIGSVMKTITSLVKVVTKQLEKDNIIAKQ
jgi:hypothetical protein